MVHSDSGARLSCDARAWDSASRTGYHLFTIPAILFRRLFSRWFQLDSGDPEKGVPANAGFLRRAALCKWMYMMGILQDPIIRVPEDPETLADLVSGRRRLGR